MTQTRLPLDKRVMSYIWQRTTVSEYAAKKEAKHMKRLGYNVVLTYNPDGTITISLI